MDRPCCTFGCVRRLSNQVPERVRLCSGCQRIFGNHTLSGIGCLITTDKAPNQPCLTRLQELFDLLQERQSRDVATWLLSKLEAGALELDIPVVKAPLTLRRTSNAIPFQIRIDAIWYVHGGDLANKIAAFREQVKSLEMVPVPLITRALGVSNQLLINPIKAGKLPAAVIGKERHRRYFMTRDDAVTIYARILLCKVKTPSHRKKLRVFSSLTTSSKGRQVEGPTTMNELNQWVQSHARVSVHITGRCLGIDPRRIVRAILLKKIGGTGVQPRGERYRYYQCPEEVRQTIAWFEAQAARRANSVEIS